MIIDGDTFRAALAQVTTDARDGRAFRSFAPNPEGEGMVEIVGGKETGRIALGYRVTDSFELAVDYIEDAATPSPASPVSAPPSLETTATLTAALAGDLTPAEPEPDMKVTETVAWVAPEGATIRYVVRWDWTYGSEAVAFDSLSAAIDYPDKVRKTYPSLTNNVVFVLEKEVVLVEPLSFPDQG